MNYIQLRNNVYHYRRRVPSKLQPYYRTKTIYKSLSRHLSVAKSLSYELSVEIANAVAMVDLGLTPTIKHQEPIKEHSQTTVNNTTQTSDKSQFDFKEVSELYTKSLDVSERRLSELQKYISILNSLMSKNVTQTSLDELRSKIKQLPKGNIQKYKKYSIDELLELDIPKDHLLSDKTRNEYLKVLNSILTFSYERDYLPKQFKVKTFTQKIDPREQRKALSKDTINKLISNAKSIKLAEAYKLLYLTGMRLSEAYKCSITTIDGIECFDLRDCGSLKTASSKRLIPVHRDLDPYQSLDAIRSLNKDYISKQASKQLQNLGSLYSLRHSFATDLIKANVDPSIVSELMGHKHQTMTLNRYSKGFDISKLYEAINKL